MGGTGQCSNCEKDARIAALEARNEQLEAEVGLLRTPADEALAHLRSTYDARIAELEAEVAGLRGVIRQIVNEILAARTLADPRLRFWEVQFNLRDLRDLQHIIGMEQEPLTEAEIANGCKLRAALDAARKAGV
jgi:hypothetical protein